LALPLLFKQENRVGLDEIGEFAGLYHSQPFTDPCLFPFSVPLSLLSKLFRKDPLMLSKKYKSYFIDINKEISKESFEKIW